MGNNLNLYTAENLLIYLKYSYIRYGQLYCDCELCGVLAYRFLFMWSVELCPSRLPVMFLKCAGRLLMCIVSLACARLSETRRSPSIGVQHFLPVVSCFCQYPRLTVQHSTYMSMQVMHYVACTVGLICMFVIFFPSRSPTCS